MLNPGTQPESWVKGNPPHESLGTAGIGGTWDQNGDGVGCLPQHPHPGQLSWEKWWGHKVCQGLEGVRGVWWCVDTSRRMGTPGHEPHPEVELRGLFYSEPAIGFRQERLPQEWGQTGDKTEVW